MGVVNNEIKIGKIYASVNELSKVELPKVYSSINALTEVVLTPVTGLVDVVGDENSGLVKGVDDIETDLTPTAITLTAYDNTITIQEQAIYRIGKVVTGYIRFTVSSENTSTGDYAVLNYPAENTPGEITRALAYSTWDASKKGIVNINTNGHLAVAAGSFTKGTAYCINPVWIIA